MAPNVSVMSRKLKGYLVPYGTLGGAGKKQIFTSDKANVAQNEASKE
jgi:hypothetical protein